MRHGRRNRYPGNGPNRDQPPHHRPGYLYGGRGRGCRGTDSTRCARFPWLQRRWWANPEDTPEGTTPSEDPSTEKEFLENQLEYLSKEMEQIKSRIEEIGDTETQ